VLAVSVDQRRREIGIRMALGARAASVLSLVLREGMTLTSLGLFIGASSALLLTRVLSSLLYGLAPSDPLTFVGAMTLLGTVAFVACSVPARRAARVDPMVALHDE
jgi:ABC-type antimicrobial peptide transport system permease subunit